MEEEETQTERGRNGKCKTLGGAGGGVIVVVVVVVVMGEFRSGARMACVHNNRLYFVLIK